VVGDKSHVSVQGLLDSHCGNSIYKTSKYERCAQQKTKKKKKEKNLDSKVHNRGTIMSTVCIRNI
jgi:hypothetical protein